MLHPQGRLGTGTSISFRLQHASIGRGLLMNKLNSIIQTGIGSLILMHDLLYILILHMLLIVCIFQILRIINFLEVNRIIALNILILLLRYSHGRSLWVLYRHT